MSRPLSIPGIACTAGGPSRAREGRGRAKELEIIVLRHQLGVLHRRNNRPQLADEDRALLGAVAAPLPRSQRAGWLVTPETLLRWHRRRIARHWTQPCRAPGRPSTAASLRRLIIDMANDNPTWGYRRITGGPTVPSVAGGAGTGGSSAGGAGTMVGPHITTRQWQATLNIAAKIDPGNPDDNLRQLLLELINRIDDGHVHNVNQLTQITLVADQEKADKLQDLAERAGTTINIQSV